MNRTMKALLLVVALLVLAIPALATQEGNLDNTVNGNNQCAHVDTFEVIAQYQSCEATGERQTICTACKEVVAIDVIPANGHDMKLAEEQAPTCVVDGWQIYKCTNTGCDHTETVVIKAPGHDWQEVRVVEDAKCEVIGYTLEKCLMCEEYRTVDIPALQHMYELTAHKDATCTEAGYNQYTCILCANVVNEPIAALGHAWTAWTIDAKPLCEQDGLRSRYCTRACCYEDDLLKVVKETEVIPAHGHAFDEARATVTAPTCEAAGSITGTCVYCSEVKTIAGAPATGHNFGEWTVTKAATATEEGVETRTCANCGKVETRAIPATGVVTKPEETKPEENKPAPKPSTPSNSGNSSASSSSGVEIPATGDVSMTWAYVMLVASAVVLVAMKRRALN